MVPAQLQPEPEPFRIRVPEERVAEVRRRVASYDWDAWPDAGGWSAGVSRADLRRLVDHWLDGFDWRAVEDRLAALPQAVVEVEGQRIHHVHARGDGSRPPVLLVHGWPGSFVEFERVVGPLVDAGHDVVVPSLPGYAFSTPLPRPVGPRRVASLLQGLMARLHGDRPYVVQGGDWGSHVGAWLAHDHPASVAGLHLNMVSLEAADATARTDEERAHQEALRRSLRRESGYHLQQSTRPQTLGAALADSPVGTLAWIVEKFGVWSDLPRDEDGAPDLWATYDEDQLLTDAMLYVATGTTVTSTWIYHGMRLERSGSLPAGARVEVPTGVAAFPDPVFAPPPRSRAEQTYRVVHWSEPERGGHFAALEQPGLFVADLLAFASQVA